MSAAPLADRVIAGDPRAIARAISLIENEEPEGAALIRAIFSHTGRAYLIGVTGPPGAGKSTLVDRLTAELRGWREKGGTVATAEDAGRSGSAAEAAGHGAPGRPEGVQLEVGREGAGRSGSAAEAAGHGALARPEGAHVKVRREGNGPSASAVGVGPHGVNKVGVIAVDPTSPFTGGAVLGDRLRMQSHAADEGVFIRSMATRGHLGGLARATGDAALVLDAAGKDVIVIETVGVGQDEVDIVRTADVSIVTLVPGAGDEVQALKAGIMEIGDVFVVNKADREGADRLAAAIEATLGLHAYGADEWRPPVIRTVATSGRGVAELLEAVWKFREHSSRARTARRRVRTEFRLRDVVSATFMGRLERELLPPGAIDAMVDRVAAREIDPYSAAAELLKTGLQRAAEHRDSAVRPSERT